MHNFIKQNKNDFTQTNSIKGKRIFVCYVYVPRMTVYLTSFFYPDEQADTIFFVQKGNPVEEIGLKP